MNLFIVDPDVQTAYGLKEYLRKRFDKKLNIFIFHSGESCLKKIDQRTHFVVLSRVLDEKNGKEILRAIKTINSKTEVIMLTTNEDMAMIIESFRKGEIDYVIKGKNTWQKVHSVVFSIASYPVYVLVKEWGLNKYLAMFLVTFTVMALGIYLALRLFFFR